MYESLAGPIKPELPAPKNALSTALRKKLSIGPGCLASEIDWRFITNNIVSDETLHKSIQASEVNSMLAAMPHDVRVESGRKLLDVVRPDNLTFDLLMDSYATLAQVDSALEMFDKSRQAGITPSVYSYAHLMKAFAVVKDLPRASAMYKYMQQQGVEPNLVVTTSLMATCIRTGQVDQAFSIFDTLKYKSASSAPDAQTYSLVIFACALDPQMSAERASDLFTEMTERGLKPTRETYNALIHVYSKRNDYFTEAWRISEDMLRSGIEMDKVTWHSLLSACITNRDLIRARTLVRQMDKIGNRSPTWRPDAITYQLLFRNYARAKVRRSLTPANVLQSDRAIQAKQLSEVWVDETPFTSDAVLRESAQVMHQLQDSRPELLSTQLIDTYMTIAQSFEAPERFMQDWNALYRDHEKGRHSYQIGLAASYTFKDWTLLQQVWAERQAWRAQCADVTTPSARSRKDEYGDFEATRMYIESLSRLNRIFQATQVLEQARTKYHFKKHDLKCFQTKSIQVGDEDAVLLYRDMFPERESRSAGTGHYYY
ncbi:Mitochondrial group I intron splicing factor dmr1 [Taphrina deformans PYCC 5710]|uniref:Mitochondrial group I intron splicing factor dmr1 n=1 Tax=Taphrina deformans (strain PYCC 5710 / ATCC 11124 / CBS 356.35 / IMI 108563 / JCM 9778 / NBRC 8474) TaxID=1097556 RepID=R4XD84_TAPDE|nr:Mitochondrial group I intron splicing factor dmr1 [Taphrina deformans PYCC 5710]|eukprot:CCG81288.1 Mitochondrial group I intron splicing factor dmr1 [Taphrina deformans PYCC 5710]